MAHISVLWGHTPLFCALGEYSVVQKNTETKQLSLYNLVRYRVLHTKNTFPPQEFYQICEHFSLAAIRSLRLLYL